MRIEAVCSSNSARATASVLSTRRTSHGNPASLTSSHPRSDQLE